MNKIFKVIYSKTRHCYVVVSELAKSHCKTTQSHTARNKTALTAAVLLALGTFSAASVFIPITAEAADKTKTDGSNFVGVERTDGTFEDSAYANHKGQGAHGDDSITIGLKASGSDGTITIGDRRAEKSLGSVYVGRGPGMPTGNVLPDKTDNGYWATSVGYQSDATGYGSIAIGSNATANNSYDKDSTGHGITLRTTSGDGKTGVLNGKPDIQRASVAIGYGASADNGNIAIGSYSDASTDLRTVTDDKAKAYLTDTKADSYVSVGTSDALRRISNVADGAANSDAATVGQLKKVISETTDKGRLKDGTQLKREGKYIWRKMYPGVHSDRQIEEGYHFQDDGGRINYDFNGPAHYRSYVITAKTGENSSVTGGNSNIASGKNSSVTGGFYNTASNESASVTGGTYNIASGKYASVTGGGDEGNIEWNDLTHDTDVYSHIKGNIASGYSSSVSGGMGNEAKGKYASISGGELNFAFGEGSFIAGGVFNTAEGKNSSIIGGENNTIDWGNYSTIVGGNRNYIDDERSFIAAGTDNVILGEDSIIVGGDNNTVGSRFGNRTDHSVIFAGWRNKALANDTMIIGGSDNKAEGVGSFIIASGDSNTTKDGADSMIISSMYGSASGANSMILGGRYNQASGEYSTVIGGGSTFGYDYDNHRDSKNRASGAYSSIIGGLGNEASGERSLISSGEFNKATGKNSTVIAGSNNTASGENAFISGGDSNTASGTGASVTGGSNNEATNDYASVNSGDTNTASGRYASVSGGINNIASGDYASINGGYNNRVSGGYALINGGADNSAYGIHASINGGVNNVASGQYSSMLGGEYNVASGQDSLIAGGSYGTADGEESVIVGGRQNHALKNAYHASVFGGEYNQVGKAYSTAIGGKSNVSYGIGAFVSGGRNNVVLGSMAYDSDYTAAFGGEGSVVQGTASVGVAGGSTGKETRHALAAGYGSVVTDDAQTIGIVKDEDSGYDSIYKDISSAIGYQSTANAPGTIAFGHDVGDVSGYTVTWKQTQQSNGKSVIDYDQAPTVTENYYKDAYYNRLVKLADGIDNHDAVTKEQVQYIGGIYGTDKNDANYGGKGAIGHNSVAIGSNAVVADDNAVSFGNPDIPAVNIPAYQKFSHSVSLNDADKKAFQNLFGFDVTQNSNWSKLSIFNDLLRKYDELSDEDLYKISTSPLFLKLQNGLQNNQISEKQFNNFEAYIVGTTVEDVAAVNIPAKKALTRRLVNISDGIQNHDAVAIEQLKNASGVGNNIKIYQQDEAGKLLLDSDNNPIEDTSSEAKEKRDAARKASADSWGTAIGTGKVEANNSQLVTGKTVYDEVRPAQNGTYVKTVQTTGQNLSALDSALQTVNTKAGAHTALTVEGGTSAGTQDEKTKQDVYAGKNILLHESTDKDGKVTYDLKLAKDINIGKPGKDGEDGKIGIDGKDGHIGLNGSDGITVRGLDGENGAPGKDGVTITGPKGEAGKDGIDGKVGISGTDGNDAVSISGKDGVGHIGLTGPAGTNGKDNTNAIDITVKNGYDGANGINGKNGVDGTSLTRIVYTDKTGEHQVATLEDGLKFKGDDTTVIAKKLNNTLDIIGGADSTKLTDKNIGVNNVDGKLKVQLAKDLNGITSISNQTTTKDGDKDVTTGAKIDLGSDGSVDVNGGKITNVGSGVDASGKYTTTTNAANIGDVQKIVKDAVDSASDTTNKALAGKANVDASNIGTHLRNADGSAASAEDQKANAEKWGSAIGTGKIAKDNGQLVTGKTVYDEVRPKDDGNYVKKDKTTGENLSALDSKIGKLDKTKTYNYIDSGKDVSISDNLGKLDTQVKKNADDITNINQSISTLDQNAVKYDDSSKSKVTLGGGKDGTTITNVKNGSVVKDSKEAVNGGQLYEVNKNVTNNTNEITKIKNGDFTDTSKTVIKNLAKDAVQVKAGDRIRVDEATDEKTGNKTYTISANNNGTVAKNDGNLISGGTLYNEVHVDKDGTYIKSKDSASGKDMTVAQNLSALDKGLKTTSDLIHTNDKGDTIQIGGSSTATKIDVSGKDANGNTTGRVITGVVSDANDPNSAANVGYVNGLTAANTQQIYRDMNNAYSRLDTNINRAAAGSNALAALHPLDFDPADKASFAVGYGHYHNANAAAVGAFYQPNANTMVNMGISLGNGDPGFNAGVSFKLGQGSVYNGVSKAEMAQTIQKQSEQINALEKANQKMEKENEEMKAQIKQILERLNG